MTSARWHRLQQLGMCLLLVSIIVSVIVVKGSTLPVPAAVNEIDEEFLELGDLLFVDIYHGWSQGGYWDHVAIYVEDPYPSVVEATYNLGISQTPVAEFVARDLPADVSVRRLKYTPHRDQIIRAVVEYALAQVGQPFDYAATATLPFKMNESNLHCAEVAWRSYKAAGIDLDSNGGLLVYPDDIYFHSKLRAP